ncbi:MAG: glycosyltransferase [Verrucomicrobia bacterium]|nr:glycosyltransferase [Verrucomicrobiota bacterium]
MRVSVVLPAFNEEKLLPAALAAVREAASAFTARGWAWECVVCDNNSTDGTAAVARAGGATVVFEPVNQIGRARDAGARAATGDWLVFIDADSTPSAALFASIADRIASGRVLGGGSTVELEPGTPRYARFVCGLWNLWSRLAGWAAGSCVWVEAAAFRAAGGFGTEYYAGEEVFLSRRLKTLARRSGRRFVILSDHPLRTSSRKLKLYTLTEAGRFFFRMLFTAGRAAKRPDACHIWYDGRR